MDSRYRATIGLTVVKEETPGFFDSGIVYSNLKYDQMLEIEAIFAKHGAEITKAMQPLIDDLVAMGPAEAQKRGAASDDREPARNPGAIR